MYSEKLHWEIYIRETSESNHTIINVYSECGQGACECIHYIAGIPVQLKPCRFIPEIFLHGDNDPDWVYILWGVVFGFHVINTDC